LDLFPVEIIRGKGTGLESKKIRCLKANVSEQQAVQAFRPGGLFSFYRQLRVGELARVASAYVPFRLYSVKYKFGQAAQNRLFAMDDVDGSLDLFQFPRAPKPGELEEIHTGNYVPAALEQERGEKLLREKALRLIFLQGMFKTRDPQLMVAREGEVIFIPYWLGFYEKNGAVRCRVMDAVRRRIEGAKASAFFEQWLSA
jgi:hypothetical protein